MGEPACVKAARDAFARCVDHKDPDWELFTAKGGVLPLADAAAAEGYMAPSREAYPVFLARYPLCYGFWKKWALQEWVQTVALADGRVPQPDRAAALASSVAVWEAGTQAVMHSSEHWANYGEFLHSNCSEDPARERAVLLRALACCTLDPKASALWDALLRLETAQGPAALGALGGLFAHALGSGAPYVAMLWTKFKVLAATMPPLQLLAEGECAGNAALAALAAGAQAGSEEDAQALRTAIMASREAAVNKSLEESTARATLENLVAKRPYYHVKPLDAGALQVRKSD